MAYMQNVTAAALNALGVKTCAATVS